MKKLALVCMLALGLSGCANLQNAWNAATSLSGSSVPVSAVSVAGNAFDGMVATATNYLKLPKCMGSNGPVCRDPAVSKKLIAAVRSARVARNNLEQFYRDHPGQLGPQGLYDTLQAAVTTLQSVITMYNIGAAK
jgi:hypothetical protein